MSAHPSTSSPTSFWRRVAAVAAGTALGASVLAASPAQAADDVTLNLIGINDFHGRIDGNTVKFAGTIEQVRRDGGTDNSLLVSAGDNVSASLFASSVQGDIPTIDVLNALDLDASAAGNHEFDKGADDLTGRLSDAADFPFLAANVFAAGGERLLEPYEIFTVDGVSVAVVGALTEETSALVSPAGIAGLTFTNPAESINDAVDELEALPEPPDVIVASVHEGAPDGAQTLEESVASSTVFAQLTQETDAAVDAIFMGHTHQTYTYDAPVPGEPGRTRPIVQTGSYGANVGNIALDVDPESGDVTSYSARNVARTTTEDSTLVSTFARVAAVKPIVDSALAFAAEKGGEPVATQTADITTAFIGTARDDRSKESTLGNKVADAQLAAVADSPADADLSVVNAGGLRSDLLFKGTGGTDADGVITFAEANAVLPFTNNLSSVTLTGAQLKSVFEQQWQRDAAGNVPTRPYLQLGTSSNVAYTFDPTRDEGDRITTLRVDDAEVDPAGSYKVAVPSFLASGGDNFRSFAEGTAVDTGLIDYEAWIAYLDENSPVAPDFGRHAVQVEGLEPDYTAGDEVFLTLPQLDLTSVGSPANTTVEAYLVQGDDETSLGEFDVEGGAATVSATLPDGVSGTANIRIEAAPSGTVATLPTIEIEAATAEASLKALTSPLVFQGSRTVVIARVDGSEGKGSGTITVSHDGKKLGEAKLYRGYALVLVDSRKLAPGRQKLSVAYGGSDDYGPAQRDLSTYVFAKRGR